MNNTVAALVIMSMFKGCSIMLSGATTAPVTRTASVNEEQHRIRVSLGIAFAIDCRDRNTAGMCRDMTVTSSDPAVVEVLPAYAKTVLQRGVEQGGAITTDRSLFVLVGHARGRATISVTNADDSADYDVEVVDP